MNEEKNNNNSIAKSGQDWGGGGPGWWSKYKLAVIIGLVILVLVAGVSVFLTRQGGQPTGDREDKDSLSPDAPRVELQASGELFLAPSQGDLLIGDELEVEVLMGTNGYNAVVAGVILEYDEEKLEVTDVNTKESVLSLGVENSVENGQVRIIRGEPGDGDPKDSDDGFTGGSGLVASFTLKAKAVGEAEINFVRDESKLYVDDGRGTSMEMEFGDGVYNINDE